VIILGHKLEGVLKVIRAPGTDIVMNHDQREFIMIMVLFLELILVSQTSPKCPNGRDGSHIQSEPPVFQENVAVVYVTFLCTPLLICDDLWPAPLWIGLSIRAGLAGEGPTTGGVDV